LWSNWWNEDWQAKPKYSEKTCPSDAVSSIDPMVANHRKIDELKRMWKETVLAYLKTVVCLEGLRKI
jgi:hypothetical protein